MFFTSAKFIFLFLPISLLGYYGLGRFNRTAAASWLAIASIVYYGLFNPAFVPLLVGSMALNYGLTLVMDRLSSPSAKNGVLAFGIVADLCVLFFFKYMTAILAYLHLHGVFHGVIPEIPLPIGISFFTFTQIAFLVDHRQGLAKERSAVNYSVFVTFFPHIVSGPILHHKEIMPQLANKKTYAFKIENLYAGALMFSIGFLKKTLFADQAKVFSDAIFTNTSQLGFTAAWVGVLFYAMQLYFDFSGYSDMAVGLARMFGVTFPANFNSPYRSRNLIEYWQRWHMTLTRYLTLYVYNPLALWVARRRAAQGKPASGKAGARWAGFGTALAAPTLATMLASGVWHGAGLHFAVWGLLHAIFLIINHAWRLLTQPAGKQRKTVARSGRASLADVASIALTFVAVLSAMVLFRAVSVGDALKVYQAMIGMRGLDPGGAGGMNSAFEIGLLALLLAIVWLAPNSQNILAAYQPILERKIVKPAAISSWFVRKDFAGVVFQFAVAGIGCGLILMILLSTSPSANPFVYAFF